MKKDFFKIFTTARPSKDYEERRFRHPVRSVGYEHGRANPVARSLPLCRWKSIFRTTICARNLSMRFARNKTKFARLPNAT